MYSLTVLALTEERESENLMDRLLWGTRHMLVQVVPFQ